MFKFNKFNTGQKFELSIENMLTKLHGISEVVTTCVINTSVDYSENTISFSVFDMEGATTERYFQYLQEDTELLVRLRVYRHDNTVDYTKRFHGARLTGRKVAYDYGSSNPTQHVCVVTFDSSEIESFAPAEAVA
jgi:hypothetical protein